LLGIFCSSICSSSPLIATLLQNHNPDAGTSVTLELSNSADQTVALLRWHLPLDNRFVSDSFNVQLNGRTVRYIGPLVKYAGPSVDDYVLIAPNESITFDIQLHNYYDFSLPGQYYVFFEADVLDYYYIPQNSMGIPRSREEFTPCMGVISNRLQITTNESLAPKAFAPYPCSDEEKDQMAEAAASQKIMIGHAVGGIEGDSPTYREWMGAFSNSRHQTARECVSEIHQNIVVNYACDDMAGVFAYVYPNDLSHTIYCCSVFWTVPVEGGYDTKAGTLIHELSHFNNICGTDDWAYGVTNARALARSNPDRAINNADNYEYFCESLYP